MSEPAYRTALITGASSGLGAEYARQLAQEGCDLILVARRLDRLVQLGRNLEMQFGTRTEALQADLATDEGVSCVEACIARLPELYLLINNAGYGLRGRFNTDPIQKHLDLIHVQVNASVRLARAALEGMVPRNRGAIINVSSMAAFLPLRNVTYCSVKAYLVNFSRALQSELWGTQIKIQAFCPGFVITEFHDTPELKDFRRSTIPKIFWLQAPQVVRESLDALHRNQVVVIPSWQYKAVGILARTPLTSGFLTFLARQLFSRRRSAQL